MDTDAALPPLVESLGWDADVQVIRLVWAPGAVCGGREARAATDSIEALGHGAVPLLVDMRGMSRLEREAREHFKESKGETAAIALLVGSPVTRMLANFFIGMDQGRTPIRMFSTEVAALAWLRTRPA